MMEEEKSRKMQQKFIEQRRVEKTNEDFVEIFLCPWLGYDRDALMSIIYFINVPSYAVQKEKFFPEKNQNWAKLHCLSAEVIVTAHMRQK